MFLRGPCPVRSEALAIFIVAASLIREDLGVSGVVYVDPIGPPITVDVNEMYTLDSFGLVLRVECGLATDLYSDFD